ncbi:hypothetical protein BJP22_03020 [Aeromonas veronii]|nr:hypothetical protein BJP22_03020 [Aeromonas veronii]
MESGDAPLPLQTVSAHQHPPLHDRLNKQVASELHLAEHAHLRISGLAMLGAGIGKRSGIVWGIGHQPHNIIGDDQFG